MSELARLSAAVGASERTLRRAARSGLFQAEWLSERRLRIPYAEHRYLTARWPLLAALRRALRTEPNIRLAVLFGSAARGEDGPDSDVDVLVELRDPGRFRMMELEDRLAGALSRPVDLVRLGDARRDQLLLSEILADGRVLVDRDELWPELTSQRDSIRLRSERDLALLAGEALRRALRPTAR